MSSIGLEARCGLATAGGMLEIKGKDFATVPVFVLGSSSYQEAHSPFFFNLQLLSLGQLYFLSSVA